MVAGVAVAGVRQRAAAGVRRARGRYSCPVSPCEEVVVRVRRPVVFSSAARLRRFGGRRSRAGRRRAEVCTCAGEGVRHRQVRCRGRAGAHVLRPAAATRTVRATPTSYYSVRKTCSSEISSSACLVVVLIQTDHWTSGTSTYARRARHKVESNTWFKVVSAHLSGALNLAAEACEPGQTATGLCGKFGNPAKHGVR